MNSPNRQEALVNFRDRFNILLDDVSQLDDGVKAKWGGTVAMACDMKNNMANFVYDGSPINAAEYFEFQEKVLFNSGNVVGGHYNQSGVWINRYEKSFGTRSCVGTTFGEGGTNVANRVSTTVKSPEKEQGIIAFQKHFILDRTFCYKIFSSFFSPKTISTSKEKG